MIKKWLVYLFGAEWQIGNGTSSWCRNFPSELLAQSVADCLTAHDEQKSRADKYERCLRENYVEKCEECRGRGEIIVESVFDPVSSTINHRYRPCFRCAPARIALGMTTTNEVKPTKGE